MGNHVNPVVGAKFKDGFVNRSVKDADFLPLGIQDFGAELVIVIVLPDPANQFAKVLGICADALPHNGLHFIFRFDPKNDDGFAAGPEIIILVVSRHLVRFKSLFSSRSSIAMPAPPDRI